MKKQFLMITATLSILALAGIGLALEDESSPSPDVAQNFSGQWVLNQAQSQDLTAVMVQAMGERRGSAGGRSGGRGGGGRRGGGMRGGMGGGMGSQSSGQHPAGSNANQAKMQERALRMQKEYSRLEIFHDGPELNLTNGLDISQLHFTDGRESSIWTERGEMKARTQLDSGTLRIRISPPGADKNGPGQTREFHLSGDGSQLILIEKRPLPGKKEPLRFRMVYDRAH